MKKNLYLAFLAIFILVSSNHVFSDWWSNNTKKENDFVVSAMKNANALHKEFQRQYKKHENNPYAYAACGTVGVSMLRKVSRSIGGLMLLVQTATVGACLQHFSVKNNQMSDLDKLRLFVQSDYAASMKKLIDASQVKDKK